MEIYDPNNNKVYTGTMVEIASGVYELSVPFSKNWGTGEFIVKATDSIEGLSDTMTIQVLSEEEWFATMGELRKHDRKMMVFKMI